MPDVALWDPIPRLAEALRRDLEMDGLSVTLVTSFSDLRATDATVVVGYVDGSGFVNLSEPSCHSFLALLDPGGELSAELILALGARGVLTRGAKAAAAVAAVRAVMAGLIVIEGAYRPAIDVRQAEELARLSPEELHWIRQSAEGSTLKQIAADSGHSERTLSRKLTTVYRRLGVRDLDEALLLVAAAHLL